MGTVERECLAYLQTNQRPNRQHCLTRSLESNPTWLGVGPNLRQLELAADGVAAVRGDPALDALGTVVAEAHATPVDGVDLRVGVEVADTWGDCAEARAQ